MRGEIVGGCLIQLKLRSVGCRFHIVFDGERRTGRQQTCDIRIIRGTAGFDLHKVTLQRGNLVLGITGDGDIGHAATYRFGNGNRMPHNARLAQALHRRMNRRFLLV